MKKYHFKPYDESKAPHTFLVQAETILRMRGKEYGLIADEVAKVAPSLVTFENNQPQGVKYSKVVALLIEAMKHQQKEIDELKSNMPKKRGRKPKTQG